jgi:hypothetical protein
MRSDEFKAAVAAQDLEAMEAALAPDVRFLSPAVFKPYEGREATMVVLSAVSRVFEDFRYLDQFEGEDGDVLLFAARVGDRELIGIDLVRFNEQGKVRELMVMIRPFSGLQALLEAMARELEKMGIPVGR